MYNPYLKFFYHYKDILVLFPTQFEVVHLFIYCYKLYSYLLSHV